MQLTPDCVPCLMKRILFQAKLLNNGCEGDAVKAALEVYSKEYDTSKNSAKVATEVHRAAYAVMGADPYLKMKRDSDEIAGSFLPRVTRYVDESEDWFRAAVTVSVIGNIMDFGTPFAISSPEQFENRFSDMLAQGIGSDDTDRFRELLGKSESILYFFDNCGESQFDKLLIRQIRKMGVRVVGVVRGAPILNDVAYEDAIRVGLDKELDRIVTTGGFMIGADLKKAAPELKEELAKADLIVAKGMANYESLSDQDAGIPKVHLLRTKCEPVARSLGVPTDINVVRVCE